MQEAIQAEIQSEVDDRRAAQQAQRAMEDEGGVLLDNPNHQKEAWRPLRRSRKGKLAEPNGSGRDGELQAEQAREGDDAELDREQQEEEDEDDLENSEDGEEEDDEEEEEALASDEEWVTETDKLGNTTRRKAKLAEEDGDVEQESVDTLAEGARQIAI